MHDLRSASAELRRQLAASNISVHGAVPVEYGGIGYRIGTPVDPEGLMARITRAVDPYGVVAGYEPHGTTSLVFVMPPETSNGLPPSLPSRMVRVGELQFADAVGGPRGGGGGGRGGGGFAGRGAFGPARPQFDQRGQQGQQQNQGRQNRGRQAPQRLTPGSTAWWLEVDPDCLDPRNPVCRMFPLTARENRNKRAALAAQQGRAGYGRGPVQQQGYGRGGYGQRGFDQQQTGARQVYGHGRQWGGGYGGGYGGYGQGGYGRGGSGGGYGGGGGTLTLLAGLAQMEERAGSLPALLSELDGYSTYANPTFAWSPPTRWRER